MILIYSKDIDDFVNQVIDCLNEDYILIGDSDEVFIDEVNINAEETKFKIASPFFGRLDIDKLESVWFNGGNVSSNGSNYENECYSMLIDSFLNFKDVNKIGRLRSDFEINKLDVQLEAVKQGFKVPETLIVNNKSKLIEFYNKYSNQDGIICKRITDQLFYKYDDYIYNFNPTFLVDLAILNDLPENFAVSLFQERIMADFEIRVIYIKGRFYSMSVHTFDNEVDYRLKLSSQKKIRIVPFNLPTNIKIKIKNVFKKLNLNYGSADLMYYNNEFYFLEINPTGQVSFVNNACNFYIENELSKLLSNG